MGIKRFLLGLLLSTLSPQFSTVFAQGSLTQPAGPPRAIMKSLDRIVYCDGVVQGSSGYSFKDSTGSDFGISAMVGIGCFAASNGGGGLPPIPVRTMPRLTLAASNTTCREPYYRCDPLA